MSLKCILELEVCLTDLCYGLRHDHGPTYVGSMVKTSVFRKSWKANFIVFFVEYIASVGVLVFYLHPALGCEILSIPWYEANTVTRYLYFVGSIAFHPWFSLLWQTPVNYKNTFIIYILAFIRPWKSDCHGLFFLTKTPISFEFDMLAVFCKLVLKDIANTLLLRALGGL